MPKPIVLICSVDLELKPVLHHLEAVSYTDIRMLRIWNGVIGTQTVMAVAGGIGKTNGAYALTTLIAAHSVSAVIGFGVSGAYARSSLEVGDVAVAESETYGDEGVDTPKGWISTSEIGIPLARFGETELYNEFPADPQLTDHAVGAMQLSGRRVATGPFVTVSCCSGSKTRGDALASRFGAICESMEGAAYAHVAALHNLPFLQLRGISNLVEDRDLSAWKLEEAATNAASAVVTVVRAWPERLDDDTRFDTK